MKRKSKIALIITASILASIAIVIGALNIYLACIGNEKQKGISTGSEWSVSDETQSQRTQKIDMGEEDFKVLVLSDIHLKNHGTFAAWLGVNYIIDWVSNIALDGLVKKTKPDFIIVLGDTTLTKRNDIEYRRFVKNMDSYQIPWACVFGNHDDEGRADKAKLADVLKTSEYGLFEYGPKDLHGAGNYVIELQRKGKTDYALFFMDSGSSDEFPNQTEGINEKQIAWYEWNMAAFAEKYAGETLKNMAFFHIPLPQYSQIETFEQGERGEDSCPENGKGNFFESLKKYHATHVFAGHDHSNNFISLYEGIKLCYATKSSYNCYYKSGMTGGTLLTFNCENQVKEEIIYFS